MSSFSFNTANQTFRSLFGNGLRYSVPRFQRDYAWTEEQWDDLWQDLLGVLEEGGESAHYMGYLLLKSDDNRQFSVIDGQQRLTTLSILILAVLKNLQEMEVAADEKKQRMETMRSAFIGQIDLVTLIPQSKLNLNRHNDDFYQDYLVPLEEIPRQGLNVSERKMRDAFLWLRETTRKHCGSSAEALARLVDHMADRFFFTVMMVPDELNAFKVFETLNSRSVPLSSTDLLKNYLFSVVDGQGAHKIEIDKMEKWWGKILGKLGNEEFPDFLWIFWNSRNKMVRKSGLFKQVREQIKDRVAVFNLLRAMNQEVDLYMALHDSKNEYWEERQRGFVHDLQLFNTNRPYPFLMAAYRAFSSALFSEVFRKSNAISFRNNVIGESGAGGQERLYNRCALAVSGGEASTLQETLKLLHPLYPNDHLFQSMFSAKELNSNASRNRKIIRHILFSIERHLSGKAYDGEDRRYTVEHILPENPGEEWVDYEAHREERFIYRLGNYTLIERDLNSKIGNSGFEKKRIAYSESNFEITKRIAKEYDEWGGEAIDRRQRWMAKQAAAIWRI